MYVSWPLLWGHVLGHGTSPRLVYVLMSVFVAVRSAMFSPWLFGDATYGLAALMFPLYMVPFFYIYYTQEPSRTAMRKNVRAVLLAGYTQIVLMILLSYTGVVQKARARVPPALIHACLPRGMSIIPSGTAHKRCSLVHALPIPGEGGERRHYKGSPDPLRVPM